MVLSDGQVKYANTQALVEAIRGTDIYSHKAKGPRSHCLMP